MQDKKVLVFIPTFNDFHALDSIFLRIHELYPFADILVVDDGSELSFEYNDNIKATKLPFNMGLGVATHVALDYAIQHDYSALVRIDSDDQHPVEEIEKLLLELDNGYDLAVASRHNRHEGEGARSLLAKVARKYICNVAKLTCKNYIPSDLNTGFMAFNSRTMKMVNELELERYPEPQIILNSSHNGFKIKEVFIEQMPRLEGNSTIGFIQAFRMIYRVTINTLLVLLRS